MSTISSDITLIKQNVKIHLVQMELLGKKLHLIKVPAPTDTQTLSM